MSRCRYENETTTPPIRGRFRTTGQFPRGVFAEKYSRDTRKRVIVCRTSGEKINGNRISTDAQDVGGGTVYQGARKWYYFTGVSYCIITHGRLSRKWAIFFCTRNFARPPVAPQLLWERTRSPHADMWNLSVKKCQWSVRDFTWNTINWPVFSISIFQLKRDKCWINWIFQINSH